MVKKKRYDHSVYYLNAKDISLQICLHISIETGSKGKNRRSSVDGKSMLFLRMNVVSEAEALKEKFVVCFKKLLKKKCLSFCINILIISYMLCLCTLFFPHTQQVGSF